MPKPENIGRYRVVRRIGGGGMGELYLGVSSGLEGFRKIVAIKRLLPSLSADEEYVGMFLQEARIAATLDHPNIVNVIDVDKDGDDYYLVMSFLEGASVDRIIRYWRKSRKRPDFAFVVAVGLGIAAGLDYAHNKRDLAGAPLRIVHRDVSPHNIFATYQGEVKLLDFGIAKAASSHIRTAANVRKGKAGYMAPEQCRGKKLDARTDIFGLGVVLYELSTLTRPFGEGIDELVVLSKTLEGDFTPPEQIIAEYPPLLSQILSKAMDPNPDNRFESARAMHDALLEFARSEGLDVASRTVARSIEECLGPRKPPVETSDAIPTGFTALAEPPPIPEFGVTAQTKAPHESRDDDTPTSIATGTGALPPRRSNAWVGAVAAAVVAMGGVATFIATQSGGDEEAPAAVTQAPAPDAPNKPVEAPKPKLEPEAEKAAAKAKFGGVDPGQLVRLVNERSLERSLDFGDRHAILTVLEDHPKELKKVDTRLQASLDLRQAHQASDPCGAFRDALKVVQESPDGFYLGTLMTVAPPSSGTDCDGLVALLAEARKAVESKVGGR